MEINHSTQKTIQVFLAMLTLPVLLCSPKHVSAQKKEKKDQVVKTEVMERTVLNEVNTYEYLGLIINANESENQLFYYDRPHVISMIGCTDCEIRAFTYFETDPDKKEYLDSMQFKVGSSNGVIKSTDCAIESSFADSYTKTLHLFIGWAPIAPITLEFYKNGVKLPIERQFNMAY